MSEQTCTRMQPCCHWKPFHSASSSPASRSPSSLQMYSGRCAGPEVTVVRFMICRIKITELWALCMRGLF